MIGAVLICGLGRVGQSIFHFLRQAQVEVVVIDTLADPADARFQGVRVIRGDCRNPAVLAQVDLSVIRGAIVATSDDLVNTSCALQLRRLNPQVRIVIRLFNQNLLTRLGKAVSNISALSVSALSAPMLANTAITGQLLATFPLGDQPQQVVEINIGEQSKWLNLPLRELPDFDQLHLLAHAQGAAAPRLGRDIILGELVRPGDTLTLAGPPAAIKLALGAQGVQEEVHWAGKIRRFARLVYRTFKEIDRPVRICTIALLIVVASSTGFYHFSQGHSWSDSLYRTISVISTGGDLGGQEYQGLGKVFVSTLKIFGTVVVAAFTAILTNYLIRAKIGGAFEVRRIPERGHAVVIGLGNVGYRVAQELRTLGESVVVIEQKKDNPFVIACRRLKIPVVLGDATVKEVLQQARVEEARAVVAATSTDLVNLEIALLTNELNPNQRVVVRFSDAALAEMARTVAGVKMAHSLPGLAAPAFVAALFGDKVLALLHIQQQLAVIVELTVQASDVCLLNQTAAALGADYRLQPLVVLTSKGPNTDRLYRLGDGDRLVALLALGDFERLSRRDPVAKDCYVEVTEYPLSARSQLELALLTQRALPGAELKALLDRLPFQLTEATSIGNASELVAHLGRDRIVARVVRLNQSA